MKKYYEPVLGFISSVGFKGVNDLQYTATSGINISPDLVKYFWIGVLGALGGLLVKVVWGCLKLWFPKLGKIDKTN